MKLKMKALAITHKGFENICSKEIKELLNLNSEVKDSVVLFDYKGHKELCKLCYLSQSTIKIISLLDKGQMPFISGLSKKTCPLSKRQVFSLFMATVSS